MLLNTVKKIVKEVIDERKSQLLKSLISSPAESQTDLWKHENILAQCRELDYLEGSIETALDEKDKKLQEKD